MHISNERDFWGCSVVNKKILSRAIRRAMKKNRSGFSRTSSARRGIDHPPCIIHVRTRTRSTVVTRNGGQRGGSFFEHRPHREKEKSYPSLPAVINTLLSNIEPLGSTCADLTCGTSYRPVIPRQWTPPSNTPHSTENEWERESSTILLKHSISPNPVEMPSLIETIADDESSVFNLKHSSSEEDFGDDD